MVKALVNYEKMNKTLLLGVNGVLVRDRVLLDHVKNNTIQYVSKKLPREPNPNKLTNELTRVYGHVTVGLRKEYGIKTHDFVSRVYDSNLLDHLADFIDSHEFYRDIEIIRRLVDMGWDVELLSNSPLVWSEPVKYAIDPGMRNTLYEKPVIDMYHKFDPCRKYIYIDSKLCNLLPTAYFDNWSHIHFSEKAEFNFLDGVSSMKELFIHLNDKSIV
jgi:hypothetical protein